MEGRGGEGRSGGIKEGGKVGRDEEEGRENRGESMSTSARQGWGN